MLSKEQVLKLKMDAYRKGIKNKDIAAHIGVSQSAVSLFFNLKSSLSKEKVEKMKLYIGSKSEFEYRVVKVPVN